MSASTPPLNPKLNLTLERDKQRTPLGFAVHRMINAGFVGRDQAAVRAHIDELAAEGVPAPPCVPMLFPVLRSALTTGGEVEVVGPKTSGEAECVLLLDGDNMYIGVGSDHTDRALEAVDMLASKQVCANIMGDVVWDYRDVADHWDDLVIESWTTEADGAEPRLYQRAPLATLLAPDEVCALVRARSHEDVSQGTVIFGGTVPIQGGQTIYGSDFRCVLRDPKRGRELACAYRVTVLDDLTTDVSQ